MPEALEPSEGDTKKRRVESFDDSVDWFQREKPSIAWLTNSSDEREIFGIDDGDPLESQKSFCRDSSVWLSKRLSDGESTQVTYHCLLPGQQLQFDEAMTQSCHKFWLLMQSAASRKKKKLNLKPERLLRIRWDLTWKNTEGGDRKAKARLVILGIPAPRTYKCTDSSINVWKAVMSFVTASMRPAQTSGPFL